MDTITRTLPAATLTISYDLRHAIDAVFASWERFLERSPTLCAVPVVDAARDRYLLLMVDTTGSKYESRLLAHMEIRNGKIWVLTDNTEYGVGTELVEAGIPPSQIVLAFYPPEVREIGEFAVS